MSGRISIDNLSDSLKEMIANSGSGLSEEQVLNLINENGLSEEQVLNLVKNNLTGDISQLSTEEKGSLVGAINELFQNANNGKELIASAIGEPLSSEDTFSAMSNDINGLLSTFKTNMMNSGVMVEGTDKFKALIDKIATLSDSEGKGIKYASGTYTCKQSVEEKESFNIPINLDFVPTIVFVVKLFNTGNSTDPGPYNYILTNNNIASFLTPLSGDARYPDRYKISSVDNLNITITLVDVKELHGTRTFGECTWYAIGVGEEDTTLRDSLASILEDEGVEVTEEDDMASLIGKVDEEFDRQVVPQGTATINDVVSGKTFINSTGQLLTGTASKGLATATGTVNVSSTLYTSKSFTINIDFTPTRLILIVPKVWYNSGVIEHKNVIVTNETTTLNAGPNENGTIKVSSMTSYSFNIQMKGLQIPECTITWIAIG